MASRCCTSGSARVARQATAEQPAGRTSASGCASTMTAVPRLPRCAGRWAACWQMSWGSSFGGLGQRAAEPLRHSVFRHCQHCWRHRHRAGVSQISGLASRGAQQGCRHAVTPHRRHASSVTAPERAARRSSRRASCRRESSQSRPLRAYREDGGRNRSCATAATADISCKACRILVS